MTDPTSPGHLARLLERVAPSEPPLRRRQPALFETAQAAPAEPMVDVVETSPVRRDDPPAIAHTVARPRAADVPVAPVQPAAVLHAEPEADRAPPAALRPVARADRAPRVDPTVRAVIAEAPPRAMPMAAQVAAILPAATRVPAALPAQPASLAATPPRPTQPPAEPVRPQRLPAPRAEAPAPASRAQARPVPAAAPLQPKPTAAPPAPAPVQPRAAQPPALSPRHATRRQAAAPPPAPRAAARELPPIEVTIGRIDVRAVTGAPAAPRATNAAAPRLSLDQYLRDRGGDR